MPRWTPRFDTQKTRAISFGTLLPSFADMQEHACVFNLYENIWSQEKIEEGIRWWRELPKSHVSAGCQSMPPCINTNKDNIANTILAAMPDMLEWGGTSSILFRILGHSVDLLDQDMWKPILQQTLHIRQHQIIAAILLQISAKMNWTADESCGSATSLAYFCKRVFAHYEVDVTKSDHSTMMLLDMMYVNVQTGNELHVQRCMQSLCGS